jgi:hypothetical protein
MTVQTIENKAYCNILAMQKGLDPAGYAHDFDDSVIVEIPLPWKKTIYQEAGALPQEMIDLMALWLKDYHEGKGYRHRPLMVAPDHQYSRPGYRRVMFYTRQPGANFDKIEYSVPEKDLGALVWALYEAREELPQFERYRTPEADATRDLLVCTHGTVDAACAKFGYPLFNYLRKKHACESLRVWRVSHFGGHVFAPTMMDMPTGHYWAYVEQEQATQIVERNSDVAALRGHYRGWAGLEDGFMQAAERDMWQREGWDWFSYRRFGSVMAQDTDHEEPTWMEVCIEFASPDNTIQGSYQARVELHQLVETPHTTGHPDSYPYPQYVVTAISKRS